MQNIQKTRFIAANYTNLQGLKSVPLGLLLLLVVVWANTQHGAASDLTLPILFSLGAAILTWWIYRYYRVHYGKVEAAPKQKSLVWVYSIVGGVAGLAAFILDTAFDLPFSLIGLVFAFSVLGEYWRMQYPVRGNYFLPVTLVCFAILLVTSLLPLLGFDSWWKLLGLRAQLFGVLTISGIVMMIWGVIGHWYFVHLLPPVEEG